MNTFGRALRLTTFGESHGIAIGGILDGFPAGIRVDFEAVDRAMRSRRPGNGNLTSPRREDDKVEFLSGFSADGISLGTSIGFIIRNTDHHSSDYDSLKDLYRPNHADFAYQMRYGIRDHRGGGRSSARETANWVAAGALAEQLLSARNISIRASISSIGGCDDQTQFNRIVSEAKEAGDSVGGTVECIIENMPAGIGDPVFGKLDATLAMAMMGINGVKGVEIGDGIKMADMHGSEAADIFTAPGKTLTNHSGGVQGGISNGMPIVINVAFKPTPTISIPLETINTDGNTTLFTAKGRHDPCIAIRGVYVVKAMAALTIADFLIADGWISNGINGQ